MSRSFQIPSYRLHKSSGQAIVSVGGRDHYLGLHNTPESKQKYARLIQEWLASSRVVAASSSTGGVGSAGGLSIAIAVTINELTLAFWEHAKKYYVKDGGEPTGEQQAIRYSLRPLVKLYGDESASEFGPRKLKAVRQAMIGADLARTLINKRINRIRHVFKWGVENEMVSPVVLDALRAVAPLKQGRCEVRESEPVKPVEQELVNAVEPFVASQVWAMIRLQLLTAMRPGEVVTMRRGELDRSGKVWVYTPPAHKTAHRGHRRRIYLGPQAQATVLPFLARPDDAYLFSPIEAEKERRAEQAGGDATAPDGGNRIASSNKNRPPKSARTIGQRYTRDSYRRAITRGCDWAFPPVGDLAKKADETQTQYESRLTPEQSDQLKAWQDAHHWHPHQLRHNTATFLRQEFGVEAARLILGHRSVAVTELYAELDHAKAVEIIAKVG
ncbi:MAG: site-specific integrase [Phycisphaerales bacterium]|nr:site-specific integrase [Phycisphaerales bacterium]